MGAQPKGKAGGAGAALGAGGVRAQREAKCWELVGYAAGFHPHYSRSVRRLPTPLPPPASPPPRLRWPSPSSPPASPPPDSRWPPRPPSAQAGKRPVRLALLFLGLVSATFAAWDHLFLVRDCEVRTPARSEMKSRGSGWFSAQHLAICFPGKCWLNRD
ncbi:hypothetical protein GUJ93_ZPchr0012g21171 [Zizania palustris]|uniref:Uncharacterized protein n=1 Tax=Zizania palustris TaxID=103762 RepID=A0A8J5WME7_ZIZPA|nr:hypothetical protein GUJ93_ZPchr0012g21171 [Zizania palustris]